MNLRQLAYILLDRSGFNAVFRQLNAGKLIILWYHGICDDDFQMLRGFDERHIPKSLFREQLTYLKEKGYQFATMTEGLELLNQKKDIHKTVVLTFDDGFRNVIDNAYPIMKELGARGCVYVVSDVLSKQNLLWTDIIEMSVRNHQPGTLKFNFKGERLEYRLDTQRSYEKAIKDIKAKLRSIPDAQRKELLNQFPIAAHEWPHVPKEFRLADWREIKTLDQTILEVGSHTRHHPDCANLSSPEEFAAELQGSKADIEAQMGYTIDHFCYPAGSYDNRVMDYVQKYGYRSATTIHAGFNDPHTSVFELRRIPTDENFWAFKARLSGSFFFVSRLLQWIKGKRHEHCLSDLRVNPSLLFNQ